MQARIQMDTLPVASTLVARNASSGACGASLDCSEELHLPHPTSFDADPAGRDGQPLHAAGLALADALAAARDSVARCELALTLLADLRLSAAAAPDRAAPEHANGNGTPGLMALNGARAMLAGDAPTTTCVATCHAENAITGQLTPREIEVVSLIAAGLSNKELAAGLFISVRTVERHINNIYRKIDARSKADATAWAIRHDLA